MKDLKKIVSIGIAFTATFSFAVGCVLTEDGSNSSSSSVENEDTNYSDTYLEDCELGEWELVRAADCETKGIKVRRCTNHQGATHEDYEFFAAREHSYDSQGVCEVCEKELVLPTPDAGANYIDPADPDNEIWGTGTQYSELGVENSGKYEFWTGEYYTITIGNSGECWFRFGVDEPGQYAVISTSNPSEVSLQQYTENAGNNFENGETKYFDDGNFLAVVRCTELYFNVNWSSAYRLTGNAGDTVKFYITKVAPAPWEAGYEYVDKFATQIDGKKAPEGDAGKTPVDVPYTATYFYDEACGYYRMGSKSNPAEIIYMAITANMPRLLGDNSFVGLQESGSGLRFHIGNTVEGDYIMGAFEPMIYNDPDYNGTEESYQSYVNSDGLYPVTQELYDFLQLYTKRNTPIEEPDEGYESNAWLSACFYYDAIVQGSAKYPIQLNTIGNYTAKQLSVYDKVYYQFKPAFSLTNSASLTCTITVKTEGVYFWIDGVRHSASEGEVTFEATVAEGVILSFMYDKMELVDIEFTIFADLPEEGDKVDNDK